VIAIYQIRQVTEWHEGLFVLLPVRLTPHVGLLLPIGLAGGEQEAGDIATAPTAMVPVSEDDLATRFCWLLTRGG